MRQSHVNKCLQKTNIVSQKTVPVQATRDMGRGSQTLCVVQAHCVWSNVILRYSTLRNLILEHEKKFRDSSWSRLVNILTFSASKTEFLLIRLKQQLSKIHNSFLTTTHFARNLGFIFDEPLPSGTKLLHFLNLATVTFMNFVAWVEGREMSLGDTAEASRWGGEIVIVFDTLLVGTVD